MNNSVKVLLLAAAGTGLMAGTAPAQSVPSSQNGSSFSSQQLGRLASTIGADMPAKHDCKGKNSCKGQGGCNTGDQGCKAKNSCKGNGGCKTSGM
jgi:hypothetical protein